jgi:hypothetical protein
MNKLDKIKSLRFWEATRADVQEKGNSKNRQGEDFFSPGFKNVEERLQHCDEMIALIKDAKD